MVGVICVVFVMDCCVVIFYSVIEIELFVLDEIGVYFVWLFFV